MTGGSHVEAILRLHLPRRDVDANVSPDKSQVRFRRPGQVLAPADSPPPLPRPQVHNAWAAIGYPLEDEKAGGQRPRIKYEKLFHKDKYGTPLAQSLRVLSAEYREERMLRAEEKAHRLPVLISIPLVVCMLPTMIGVLMLPGAIRIVREMLPALTGG